MLVEERARLHRLPALPHTVCFGQTRHVSWQSTVSVGGAIYSVPSTLVDERLGARRRARRRPRRQPRRPVRGRPPPADHARPAEHPRRAPSAASGATGLRRKIAEATALAKLHGPQAVDDALGAAADAGRFGDGDLAAILAHHQGARVIASPARESEETSLQRSTPAWEGFGR
jgi:hypothetical protein